MPLILIPLSRFREQHLAPGTEGPRSEITTLPPNVDWKEEGDYATCLGVPIGNDLDTEKWWRKKLASVENLSKKWTGLFRNGYFGRNLVVQAMFLGRLRYWLYSVPMSKVVCAMVQDDADTLWWSKEPVIGGEKKRFRRFVGKQTAIGPRVKGGLGNVDWFSHVQSFMSSWITRYVDAADSQWKNLLDTFVLYDQRGRRRFPEGRGIFYANISKYDQYAILKNIPRRAVYIKECIRAHFKLEIQPNLQPHEDMPDTLPSEPFFRSHRFNLGIPKKDQEYYYTKLGISRMADLIHPKTRMIRTPQQWAHLVLRRGMEETRWTGHLAEHATWALGDDVAKNAAIDRANKLCAIVRKIPPGILAWLEVHMQMSAPRADELRCMLGTDGWIYGRYTKTDSIGEAYRMMEKDAVGKLTDLGTTRHFTRDESFKVAWWNVDKTNYFGAGDVEPRLLGPVHHTFPRTTGWKIDGDEVRLDELSIRVRTRLLAVRKMKALSAEAAWTIFRRLPLPMPWNKIWRIRSFYVSPRDQLAWLKVMHRNLYLAGNAKEDDTSCRTCDERENIMHLVQCGDMLAKFWNKIAAVMVRMGFTVPHMRMEREAFWLLGRLDHAKAVGPEQAGIMFIAWRCLYAAIVHSRVENAPLDLPRAYNRVWQMTITRLRAEGEKWNLWHRMNENTGNKSFFPLEYRERGVIRFDEAANYIINPEILAEYENTRPRSSERNDTNTSNAPDPHREYAMDQFANSPVRNDSPRHEWERTTISLLTEDLSDDSDDEDTPPPCEATPPTGATLGWYISTTPNRPNKRPNPTESPPKPPPALRPPSSHELPRPPECTRPPEAAKSNTTPRTHGAGPSGIQAHRSRLHPDILGTDPLLSPPTLSRCAEEPTTNPPSAKRARSPGERLPERKRAANQ